MITLNASGGSVTFTFSGNSTYLNDGTITVPVNSLALIIDESDMITFRKSASSDIFVSANIAEFGMTKDELIAWYKENMVGSTGGVDSGTVQTMIDESISGKANSSAVTEEISAAVSGKADTDSLSAYTINEGIAESSQTYNVEVTYDPPVNVYTLDKSYGGIKMFLSHSGSTSSMRPVLICYDDNDNEIGRIWIYDRTMASHPFVEYSGFTDLVKNLVDGGYSVIVEGEELTAVKKFTYYEEYWATDEETSVLFFNNAYNITNAVRFDLSKKADTTTVTEEISAAVSGKMDTSAYTVDASVNSASTNPVQNQALYNVLSYIYSQLPYSSVIENGDFEGNINHNFYSYKNGERTYCSIQDGIGKDNSRGIVLMNETGGDAFSNQLFVKMNRVIPIGTKFHVEFDYKANKVINGVSTQTHGNPPENYIYWDCIGNINFTDQWQHFSKTVTVSSNMGGTWNNFQTIAFELGATADAEYYFDNFVITAEQTL